MAESSIHPLLPSTKFRITALHQHDDRLYVGLLNGSVQVYSYEVNGVGVNEEAGEESGQVQDRTQPTAKLLNTHALSRRQIDQIGVLSESNQLVVLADSSVTLYALPDFAKAGSTTLSQARTAYSFAITTFTNKGRKGDAAEKSGVQDLLVVGCRKKVVVYGAGSSGLKDPWELPIPHSPRHIVFPFPPASSLPETVHLLFTPTSSALLHINVSSSANRLALSDLTTDPFPPPSFSSAPDAEEGAGGGIAGMSMGKGALSGLSGYVRLGGKVPAPVGTKTVGGEVLLARDDMGVFYSSEGNYTRSESLHWAGPPDALAFANPFIYSIVPVLPHVPSSGPSIPVPTLQIHLAPTLTLRQALPLPMPSVGTLAASSLTLTFSATSRGTPALNMQPATKLLIVSTPTDKAFALSEGSSVWAVRTGDIGEQVDELVREGRVEDAIGLVEAVGENGLSPSRRLPHLKTLQAVSQVAHGQYQSAMETFLVFNVNPALVLSLFPAETISGKLHAPQGQWMELFGAVKGARLEPRSREEAENEGGAMSILKGMAGLGLGRRGSVDTLKQVGETASDKSSDDKPPAVNGEEVVPPKAALEALMYFLSDRRQKLTGAIASTPLPAETSVPPLSSLTADEQHALPSLPFTELDPEQLLRMAQVIYTGLIKVYLVARPVLVGSLCRIENWCDVEEVEELLKAQKKFGDLIDLYQGKKMHAKALSMLHELAKQEEDKLDRYPPTVRYLQKLGPSELPLILESSRWIFDEDPKTALQIFTADEAEVEALPRKEVSDFLERVNVDACIGYLEHVIVTLGEEGPDYHDKLAELYLKQSGKSGDESRRKDAYGKLLNFLDSSTHYRPFRVMSRLSGDELPEARAILLGRMGKHEEALKIYVYRLEDYAAAEVYCVRTYPSNPSIFLQLLQIYLRPSSQPASWGKSKDASPSLLAPALSLISKHSTSLPPSPVLDLLPPLVPMSDVKDFFTRTLREDHARRNDYRVIHSLAKGRKEELERMVLGLEVKRVRVTDQRICPQCHKRLGQSAIAVHAPRGEVTHLHCKDRFSAKLATLRG